MNGHRRWGREQPGETATVSPPGGGSRKPSPGIPLLLLPERVVFEVDASLLLSLSPSDDDRMGRRKGIIARLVWLWLRPWEF